MRTTLMATAAASALILGSGAFDAAQAQRAGVRSFSGHHWGGHHHHYRGGWGGGWGGSGSTRQWYTCTARDTSGSGVFFLGMGRNRSEAYMRAFANCQQARRWCSVTCTMQM